MAGLCSCNRLLYYWNEKKLNHEEFLMLKLDYLDIMLSAEEAKSIIENAKQNEEFDIVDVERKKKYSRKAALRNFNKFLKILKRVGTNLTKNNVYEK